MINLASCGKAQFIQKNPPNAGLDSPTRTSFHENECFPAKSTTCPLLGPKCSNIRVSQRSQNSGKPDAQVLAVQDSILSCAVSQVGSCIFAPRFFHYLQILAQTLG